jgi:hypothetical protein
MRNSGGPGYRSRNLFCPYELARVLVKGNGIERVRSWEFETTGILRQALPHRRDTHDAKARFCGGTEHRSAAPVR